MTVFEELEAAHVEMVGPDPAIVDPARAACVRALLPNWSDLLSKDDVSVDPGREQTLVTLARHVSEVEFETAAALRRITDLADVAPSAPQPRYRVAKLVGALATWSVVAILVMDVGLYDWPSLLSH